VLIIKVPEPLQYSPLQSSTMMGGAIALPWFLAYKFTNSLFLGLSIGSVFALYSPLPPSVFS
jgi:hypothetical protein